MKTDKMPLKQNGNYKFSFYINFQGLVIFSKLGTQ